MKGKEFCVVLNGELRHRIKIISSSSMTLNPDNSVLSYQPAIAIRAYLDR